MRRLGMVEWIPQAKFRVMRMSDLYGESSWMPEERQCWIRVSPSEDRRLMEETLIHEILHVLLEGHLPPMSGDKYDAGYEFALNRAAKAFWESWSES
jgi:hypothetical protein